MRIDRSDDQADLLTDFRRRIEALENSLGRVRRGGRRNMIHNGAMRVRQIGGGVAGVTPPSIATPTGSNAWMNNDRWLLENQSGQTVTHYGYNDSVSQPAPYAHMSIIQTPQDTTVLTTDHLICSQHFEGRDLQEIGFGHASAKPITVSFHATMPAGTYIVSLERSNGSSGIGVAPTTWDRSCSKAYTITTAMVSQYVTLTFPADTGGLREPSDQMNRMQIRFWLVAGPTYNTGNVANLNQVWTTTPTPANRAAGCSNFMAGTGTNTMYFAEAQMEIGSVATPFERTSYAEDLALCQRYYRRMVGQAYTIVGWGNTNLVVTASKIFVPVSVPMRTVPTEMVVNGSHSIVSAAQQVVTPTAYTLQQNQSRDDLFVVDVDHPTVSNAQMTYWRTANDAASWVEFGSRI